MDRTERDEAAKRRLRTVIVERFGGYEGLADEIGISHQAVSDVVNGHTVGATARYAVAAALGCRVSDFWPAEEAGEQDPAPATASAPAA